jgi:HTH-type transcriptional regulator/antitoxin HigA
MGTAVAAYRKIAGAEPPRTIHSESERRYWRRVLDAVIAKPEDKLTPAEARYGETIAVLLESYERQRFPLKAEPVEVLVELMNAHGFKQKDLVDVFGSEAAVSYALRGRRALTVPQIRRLAERFRVSPAVFIG